MITRAAAWRVTPAVATLLVVAFATVAPVASGAGPMSGAGSTTDAQRTSGAGRTPVLSTAELLVDLARDQGANRRGSQTAADAQQIEVLLKAAVRLNPRLPDANRWLYELAMLRGDETTAFEAISRLVAADPGNQSAFARWLEAGLQAGQTIEQRQEWLRSVLSEEGRPAEAQAMVHVQLAKLALAALNRDEARKELDAARALNPADPDAAALRLAMLAPDAAPAERLQVALEYLEVSPLNVDVAWESGVLLDQLGLVEEAEVFLQHAQGVYALANAGAPLPAAHTLQWARHLTARGDLRPASQAIEQMRDADSLLATETAMLYYWLLNKQGREAEAGPVRAQLAQNFAALREPSEWPVEMVAQAGWFHCTIDLQAQRALMLAQAAAQRLPNDRFVRRVLGWAQAANLMYAEALATLRPIADLDPYAAYQVASILKQQGDVDGAGEVLRDLTALPAGGAARELLDSLGLPQAAMRPASDRLPEVVAVLADFNREVLSFHKDPSRFLRAEVDLAKRNPGPGEPWWATFSLTNTGDFPITLGPQWMLNPVFLLSFELEGERKRVYPDFLTVAVDRARVLPPGATVRMRQTIDVGPPRRVLRGTPQHLQRVVMRALLDPVQGRDGRWRPGLAGQSLRPVYLNRVPAQVGTAALRVLFGELASEIERNRFWAVELIAELLGEQQRASLGRLDYRPEPVSVERLQQALAAALASESAELRARTLDALQAAGLDASLLAGVQARLSSPDWLVRLMAVRLLGERKPPQWEARLRPLAVEDADELVRALAASYLPALEQPGGEIGSATGAPAH